MENNANNNMEVKLQSLAYAVITTLTILGATIITAILVL